MAVEPAAAVEVVAAGAADLAAVVAAAVEAVGAAVVEAAAAIAVVAVAAATGKRTLIGQRPICAARCVSARAAAFPARASSIRSTRPPAYR